MTVSCWDLARGGSLSSAADLSELRRRVQGEIDAEIDRQRGVLAQLGGDTDPLLDAITSLLRGGKRLRAAFCYYGYRGYGGQHDHGAIRAATALELFQAGALLHDDVMDDSDTRRGTPTAHRAFEREHAAQGWQGHSERFGEAAAILAGDLCLAWSDEMMATCGWPADQLARARPEFDAMRTQLMGGQFLDMLVSARGWTHLTTQQRLDQATRVIRFKSARYSIEQPLLIGARAADAPPADLTHLASYGAALGEAFQLRDDVLGVFGNPATTGKPAGDDIREGKRTVLLAYALDQAPPAVVDVIGAALGDPDLTPEAVEDVRRAVRATRALDRTEERIDHLTSSARAALRQVTALNELGQTALEHLIDVATDRQA